MQQLLLLLTIIGSRQVSSEVPFRGTWLPTTWELAGSTRPPKTMAKMALTLWRDHYEFIEGPSLDMGKLEFYPEKNPCELNITGVKGPNAGRKIPAIYRLEKDVLTICYGLDAQRPKEFRSPKKSLVLLVTYKRKSRVF